MIWEPFIPYPNHPNLGQIASVYLNEDRTLIKRHFTSNGITANGNPNGKDEDFVRTKFTNEFSALERFDGLWFMPKLVEINKKEKYVIQEYYGPDLSTRGFQDIPDMEDQVVSIFRYIWDSGFYKFNGSLSNMTKKDGQVLFFDFKYTRLKSEEMRVYEEYSIDTWLSKISPNIVPRLKELL